MLRTDEHNNPTAMISDLAALGGLELGVDYTEGKPLSPGTPLTTALFMGDPVELTIRVIDRVGFFTRSNGIARWVYIGIPKFIWASLDHDQKRDVIGEMYRHEGGITMKPLFPNFGQLEY
jgi:hypothetical protein